MSPVAAGGAVGAGARGGVCERKRPEGGTSVKKEQRAAK